jgi:hypothetical protein
MKKLVSYSIDDKVLMDFKTIAKDNSINYSLLIENFMKDYIKKHKPNGK